MTKPLRAQNIVIMPISDLEKQEHLAVQRIEWKLKKLFWATVTLILLAGLAGLFDRTGYLSKAEAGGRDSGIRLSYSKYAQYQTTDEVEIAFAEETPSGPLVLEIAESFFSAIAVERILPEPIAHSAAAGYHSLEFASDKGKPGGTVKLRFRPTRIGPVSATFSLPARKKVELRTFVYP